jgi:fucokinase
LRLLEAGRLAEGLAAWSRVRDEGGWLDTAARLVRAARHYEGGVQLLIRQTVMSAKTQVRVNLDPLADQTDRRPPPLGAPVIVRCPARLDLSGGWTDTPPICYELGGQVVDLAITLDGVKPIGCRAVRIPELRVEIVLPGGGGDDEDPTEKEVLLQICSLTDMADHCNPVARGALVKCCLLAAGLIHLGEEDKTTVTLASQLEQRLGSGLRLELWSDLPQAWLEKTRFKKKKKQPSGFFVFFDFLGSFWVIYTFPEERVFRVFSVSRILFGASRL